MQQWMNGDRWSGSALTARSAGGATQQRLTRLGTWFSLGLGFAQLTMPGRMARMIGVRDTDNARTLMQLVGVRELTAGLGLLSGRYPAGWFGFRAGGDLMDLALLGAAFGGRGNDGGRLALATTMVLGATAMDVLGALKLGGSDEPHSPTSRNRLTPATSSVVVNRPGDEVYQFWRDFTNFPRFMKNLESVTMIGGGRSHWKALGPAGQTFEWDAEMIEDRPNELIRWRSLPGADVENEGSIRFERAPGGRGTLVKVNLRYRVPGGVLGDTIAALFGSAPGQEVSEDLRRFKQVLEIGEVMRSDASIHSSMHPARPPEQAVPLESVYRRPPVDTRSSQEDRADTSGSSDRSLAAEEAMATRGGAR
jgi:uncharacterized membrane protein